MTPKTVQETIEDCRNSIFDYLQKFLIENNYTEEFPLKCNIALDFGYFAISNLLMPTIEYIWADPESHEIYYLMDEADPTAGNACFLSELEMEDLLSVYNDIYTFYDNKNNQQKQQSSSKV